MDKEQQYGEIINGEETYSDIAEILLNTGNLLDGNSVLIGWTDENMTHFDILFSLYINKQGTNIQGGIRDTDLFVSIMRLGAFGFEINKKEIHYGYISEKLFLRGDSITNEKLGELINGVRKHLILKGYL